MLNDGRPGEPNNQGVVSCEGAHLFVFPITKTEYQLHSPDFDVILIVKKILD